MANHLQRFLPCAQSDIGPAPFTSLSAMNPISSPLYPLVSNGRDWYTYDVSEGATGGDEIRARANYYLQGAPFPKLQRLADYTFSLDHRYRSDVRHIIDLYQPAYTLLLAACPLSP